MKWFLFAFFMLPNGDLDLDKKIDPVAYENYSDCFNAILQLPSEKEKDGKVLKLVYNCSSDKDFNLTKQPENYYIMTFVFSKIAMPMNAWQQFWKLGDCEVAAMRTVEEMRETKIIDQTESVKTFCTEFKY